MPVNQVQNAGAGRAEEARAQRRAEQDARARRDNEARQAEQEAQAAREAQQNDRNNVDMRA